MINVELAARQFLNACRAADRSPNTVNWYTTMLKPLVSVHYNRDITKISTHDMRHILLKLKEQDTRYQNSDYRKMQEGGISHESYRDYVRAFKRFFNWCVEEYSMESNPMHTIKMPPASKKTPSAISMDDFKRLLAACDNSRGGIRDKAILMFLLDTGCRAGGVVNLREDCLNLSDNVAIVTEKGNRQRTVAFSETTKMYLERWMAIRPIMADKWVFCSLQNGQEGRQLQATALNQLLLRLKKAAGVQGRVNPHSFRHAFARQYIEAGGDLASLAQLMGHSSIQVTASFYAVFDQAELSRMHRRFSPINALRDKDKR
jgi:site-specific recombinase XerD